MQASPYSLQPTVVEPPPRSGQFPIPLLRLDVPTPANDGPPAGLSEIRSQIGETIPALQRRARYLAHNRAEADDLVNDTVERALRFAASYQSGTNLRAWLLQIMYTVFASRCRRAHRERLAYGALKEDPNSWNRASGEAPDGRVLLGTLVDKLQALPPSFAEVLWLVDYQEYAYAEAAHVLGVPVGTVMSRLHRARRLMRGALETPRVVS